MTAMKVFCTANHISKLYLHRKLWKIVNQVSHAYNYKIRTISIFPSFVAPPRRPELIIRENQPIELPPDVVRSSDKTDLGLEELHQLNVKSRYEIFENAGQISEQQETHLDRSPSGVKRSATILSKLAR